MEGGAQWRVALLFTPLVGEKSRILQFRGFQEYLCI